MKDHPFLVGLDPHPDSWRAVRIRIDTPRPEVVSAAVISSSQPAPRGFFDDAFPLLAIPGSLAIIKNITLPGNPAGWRERALFELTRSFTGTDQDYLFDVIPTGLEGLILGTAVRHSVLQQEILAELTGLGSAVPARGILRTMALAHGYLAFCRPARGGLVILLDPGNRTPSLALIYRNRVVALAHPSSGRYDLTSPADCDRYAIELKTVVSFRLAALFDYGLTLPPSVLVICGDEAGEHLKAALGRYFAVPLESAEINVGFLAVTLGEDPKHMRKYLAAMGLAANFLA